MLSLLNYTVNSLGQSTMLPKEVVAFAKQAGHKIVGLTDYHTLSGAPEFIRECNQEGIKGVVGVTVNITDAAGSCGHVVFMAKDEQGVAQLREIIDEAGHVFTTNHYVPTQGISKEQLLSSAWHKKTDKCFLLDGFPGSFAEHEVSLLPEKERTLRGVKSQLQAAATPLNTLSRCRPLGYYQAVYAPGAKNALALACASLAESDVNTPPVVNTLMNYAINDVQLVASQQAFRIYAEKWLSGFKSADAASKWVINRYQGRSLPSPTNLPQGLASALHSDEVYDFFSPVSAGQQNVLKVEALPFVMMDEITLPELVSQKWEERKDLLPQDKLPEYKARLDHEMSVIQKMGFENYFLNIYQFKCLADKTGNTIMLRGSAVSSLTIFVMGMMDIDPVKEELLFARFLSEDRQEEPDVDIEFTEQKRFIQDLAKTFSNDTLVSLANSSGLSQVQIIFGKARDAMLDLYDLDAEKAKSVERAYQRLVSPLKSHRSPKIAKINLEDWLQGYGKVVLSREKDPALLHLVELAKGLDRAFFSSSVNSGSVVVVPDGAKSHFNVIHGKSKDDSEMGMIPFRKQNLGYTGFIKYDILSNKIYKRLIMAMKTAGVNPDLEVPDNDRSINYVFRQKAFLGITQMNGWTAENLSKTIQPASLTEIKAMFALMRTADTTADSESVNKYNAGRSNVDNLGLPEPMLKSLKETYGVMLYEEQLLTLLTEVAQFTWSEADRFRSALKNGKDSVIDEYEPKFIAQVSSHFKISEQEASKWYQPFRDKRGRFVFAKAHALAYAKLAVQQCWFKTYYPANYAAELYLDGKIKVKGKPVPLEVVLADWKKLHKGWDNVSNVKMFMNALGKIALREHANPSDGYNKNMLAIDADVKRAVNKGFFDALFDASESREVVLEHWIRVVERVEHRLSGATQLVKPKDTSGPAKASKSSASKDASYTPPATVKPSGEKTLNQLMKEGSDEPWLDKVMFAQLLPYLESRGVLTISSRENKAKSFDHFKFTINGPQGKFYHLCVAPDDPSRLDPSRMGLITSAILQGSSLQDQSRKNTFTTPFFRELVEQGCFPGIEPGQPNDYYHDAFKRWVLQDEKPLYGIHHMVPKSGLRPPLFAPLPLPPNKLAQAQAAGKDCLEEGRGLSPVTIGPYFERGAMCYPLRLDNNMMASKRKEGTFYRAEHLGPMANFVQVEAGKPLFNVEPVKPGYFSDGGHQTIYRDRAGKVKRPDLGTNSVYGHYFGMVTPGAETLWVGEGIFDAMAFNELQNLIPTLAPDRRSAEPNCISLKSTQNVKPFFETLLNVRFQSGDSLDFQLVTPEIKGEDINSESVALFADYLSKTQSVFLHDRTAESEEAFKTIRALYEKAGMIGALDDINRVKVIFCQESNWLKRLSEVCRFEAVTPDVNVFHKGNIAQFMRNNNLCLQAQGDAVVLMKRVVDRVASGPLYSQMSAEEKVKTAALLKKRFEYMTGAKSLGLALDNDAAGMAEANAMTQFCAMVGIPSTRHMPPIMTWKFTPNGAVENIKDHNDFLKLIKTLVSNGQHEALNQVIDHYTAGFTQEPKLFLHQEKPSLENDVQHALKRNA